MMITKMTVRSNDYVEFLGGIVQAATGDAIVDCLGEGILPKEQAGEFCMIIMVWLDPRCTTDANLVKNRKTITHYALEGVFEE